ncbi:MAG: hypothetical protein HUU21_37375 [Polyangiaceae bacterium]|nr:hypothetical protein [Polyangiaceae bacterium]
MTAAARLVCQSLLAVCGAPIAVAACKPSPVVVEPAGTDASSSSSQQRSGSSPPGPPPPSFATGGTVTVLDARSGAPIAGAEVLLAITPSGRGENPRQVCRGDDMEVDGGASLRAALNTVRKLTDAQGRAVFSDAEMKSLAPPGYDCPPGAPCAAPPTYTDRFRAAMQGYLTFVTAGHAVAEVRLVPASAAITTKQAAVGRATNTGRIAAWLSAMPYEQMDACLDRKGTFEFVADAVTYITRERPWAPYFESRPSGLPPVRARVNAITGNVDVLSCPVQGTPLRPISREGGKPVLEDLTTGFMYRCEPEVAAHCAGGLQQGRIHVQSNYSVGPGDCGSVGEKPSFSLSLSGPSRTSCTLGHCKRIR